LGDADLTTASAPSTALDRVRVVLMEPSHPGNVGAVARAMKTMGLTGLWLVRPQGLPSAEATARASGADDVLHRARRVETLEEAVAECTLVVGSSARRRGIDWPELEPRECGRALVAAARSGPAALVLGRERSGLSNEELDRCDRLVRIPANPDYSSLNLAAAAQVFCYELRRVWLEARDEPPPPAPFDAPATHAQVSGLLAHLEQVFVQTHFLDPQEPKLLMRRMSRLLRRADLEQTEVNILRGFLAAVARGTFPPPGGGEKG
jgi:tRNA/rRNA methyltransferase/tRNA (cytidine32/uridine32-2'-O)-methyltransferase